MKIQMTSALVLALALAPVALAQRGGGGGGRPSGPSGGGRPMSPGGPVMGNGAAVRAAAVQQVTAPLPSTNILPMTNPIGPVIPYGGAAAQHFATSTSMPAGTVSVVATRNGRFDRRLDNVVVVGGGYWAPYYNSYPYYGYPYYDPYYTPPTIPGQLPGAYPLPPEPASVVYSMADYATQPAPPADPGPIFYPEPRVIITPPADTEPTVDPPALGTSKADVIAKYGQPWGVFRARGQETLYYHGDMTLVMQDGKVSEVR